MHRVSASFIQVGNHPLNKDSSVNLMNLAANSNQPITERSHLFGNNCNHSTLGFVSIRNLR